MIQFDTFLGILYWRICWRQLSHDRYHLEFGHNSHYIIIKYEIFDFELSTVAIKSKRNENQSKNNNLFMLDSFGLWGNNPN